MITINQVYENAGMLMKSDRFYERVRNNIEKLMSEGVYKGWNSEATKEFMDCLFLMDKLEKEGQ